LTQPAKLVRGLSLLDSILLLASGIIGSGIFLTAADVASNTRTPVLFLSIWVIGMLITLPACFAFAEMGAMFPEAGGQYVYLREAYAGGQYVYLREAYGEFVAFLYGWMIFTVSVAGTVAALGAGFAEYIGKIFPAVSAAHVIFVFRYPGLSAGHLVSGMHTLTVTREHLVSLTAILLLTLVNIFGLRRGAMLQNIATWAKFAAIGTLVILGIAVGKGSFEHYSGHYSMALPASPATTSILSGIGVALIAVFWAYDGWVYITWVAGEVKDPQRNLPRSLVLGLLIVGALYLAINAVYLYALPMTEIAANTAVAQAAAAWRSTRFISMHCR